MSNSVTANNLLNTIKGKCQQIAVLQKEVNVLGRAYSALTGISVENIIKKIFNRNEANLTIAEAVEQSLQNEGKPLYLKQLHERLQEDYNVYSTRKSILDTIMRYINAGKKFVRTSPGRYGLLEWEVETNVSCN